MSKLHAYQICVLRISGVYIIENKITGLKYVGSSSHIHNRWGVHRTYLKQNNHKNKLLQDDWNIYGEESFSIRILERVEGGRHQLFKAEQKWIDELNPEYNISPTAGSVRGMTRTEEHKKLIGIANSKRTEEERYKMAMAQAKTYNFIDPNGELKTITNLKRFCREKGYDLSGMLKVAKGKAKSYKGWKTAL